jgi:hypothetical protein
MVDVIQIACLSAFALAVGLIVVKLEAFFRHRRPATVWAKRTWVSRSIRFVTWEAIGWAIILALFSPLDGNDGSIANEILKPLFEAVAASSSTLAKLAVAGFFVVGALAIAHRTWPDLFRRSTVDPRSATSEPVNGPRLP